MCSNSSLKSLRQLKTKFTWDHGKFIQMIQVSCSLFKFCQPPWAGPFSGDFTTNLARQCRAFSRALKIEKLKAPLFRGPKGPGLQMTGALLRGNEMFLVSGSHNQDVHHAHIW